MVGTAQGRLCPPYRVNFKRRRAQTQLRDLAACLREVYPGISRLLKNRGRRECRVRVAPMASCAMVESTRVRNHRYAAISRHSLRDGLRLIPRSPRGPGSFAPVALAGIASRKNLTPASGRQDHTTSPSASVRSSRDTVCVHRIPPQRP